MPPYGLWCTGISWWATGGKLASWNCTLFSFIHTYSARERIDDHHEEKSANPLKCDLGVVLIAWEPWVEPMGLSFLCVSIF